MATAAVIDFESFSSRSGDEWVQSEVASRIELSDFVESGGDRCSNEFEGIVRSNQALCAVLDQVRTVAPTGASHRPKELTRNAAFRPR